MSFGKSRALAKNRLQKRRHKKAQMRGSLNPSNGMWIPPHDNFFDPMTIDARTGKDSNVRLAWRPNKQGKAEDFEYLFPELCAVQAIKQTPENKLPGFDSKKIALVFRGAPEPSCLSPLYEGSPSILAIWLGQIYDSRESQPRMWTL